MRTQALVAFLVAVTLAPVACKRKMDDVIPNSTPSATATASVTAAASASAADDTAEPLAPLSSVKIAAPPPPAGTAKAATSATAAAAPVPQECGAAVLMKKLGKVNESETLRIKCVEKGGKDPFAK